ncbi:MAG: uracil-DNA glycosylase [Chloroflexota bacterium]
MSTTNALTELSEEIVACHKCPRLVAWREQVAREKRRAYRDWDYWGKPVPGFGDPQARLLIVGLAPGAHGSNRTGRMFTGDGSGDFLYPALYRAGFASQPTAIDRTDGLILYDAFISAVGRCAPPDNKPTAQEIATCLPYLQQEIALLANLRVVVALGSIAFDNLLSLYEARKKEYRFSHGAVFPLGTQLTLIASYHPSRQNTQTGRLTAAMFDSIWQTARSFLHKSPA